MTTPIQSVSEKSIYDLLKKDVFEIPLYQRSYDWDEENVEDYWEALVSSEKEENSVFFGEVVTALPKYGERMIIIDGQQRISTTCMLLEIINELADKYDNENKETILNNLEKILNKKGGYILNVCDENKDFYQNVIKKKKNKTYKVREKDYKKEINSKSNKKIAYAFDYLYEQVDNYVSKPKFDATKLYKLFNKLEDLFIIHITLKDYSSGTDIFTNLNTKGKNIESWHAIKNFFYVKFHQKKKNDEEIENDLKKWDNYFDEKNFKGPNFLKHYLQSRYSKEDFKFNITGNKIVQCFDKILNKQEEDPEVIFKDAINSIEDYKTLSNANYKNKSSNKYLEFITKMNIISPFPLLLSSIKKFDENNFKVLLITIEAALFQYQFICNNLPQKITDIFCRYAPIIFKKEDDGETYNRIIKNELKDIMPSEDIFRDKFYSGDTWRKSNKKAQIVLLEIEKDKSKGVTLSDTTLDHISPLKLNDDVDEEHKYKIGNMCLLSGKNNSIKSNKSFDEVKEILKNAGISSTEKIAEKKKWDNEEIGKRTEELFKAAQQRWAL